MILNSRKVDSEEGNFQAIISIDSTGISLYRKYNEALQIWINFKEIPEIIKFLQDIQEDDKA
jgi:hypothetical protein